MKVKHLGYFNDIEDIKTYADCSADKVIEDINNNIGHFYADTDDIIYNNFDVSRYDVKFTTDGKYMVLHDLPKNFDEMINDWNFFIDVFEIIQKDF